jgi:hypothetical protein
MFMLVKVFKFVWVPIFCHNVARKAVTSLSGSSCKSISLEIYILNERVVLGDS